MHYQSQLRCQLGAEMDDALMVAMKSNILTQNELSHQLCDGYLQSCLCHLFYHWKPDIVGIMGNITEA